MKGTRVADEVPFFKRGVLNGTVKGSQDDAGVNYGVLLYHKRYTHEKLTDTI